MWKEGQKYKCINRSADKSLTVGEYYELNHKSYSTVHGCYLYWFNDNNNERKFVADYYVNDIFQTIKEQRKDKLKKLTNESR